jgi:hypothetical protein
MGDFTEGHERAFRGAAITAITPPLFGLENHRLGTNPRAVVVIVPASVDGPHLIYRNEYFGAPIRNNAYTTGGRAAGGEGFGGPAGDQSADFGVATAQGVCGVAAEVVEAAGRGQCVCSGDALDAGPGSVECLDGRSAGMPSLRRSSQLAQPLPYRHSIHADVNCDVDFGYPVRVRLDGGILRGFHCSG